MILRLFLVVLCLQGQMVYPMIQKSPYFDQDVEHARVTEMGTPAVLMHIARGKGKEHAPEPSASPATSMPSWKIAHLIGQKSANEQEMQPVDLRDTLKKGEVKAPVAFEPVDFDGSPVQQESVDFYGSKLATALYAALRDGDSVQKVQAALTQLSLHQNVKEYWEGEDGLLIMANAKCIRDHARVIAGMPDELVMQNRLLGRFAILQNANVNLERIKRFDRQMAQKK